MKTGGGTEVSVDKNERKLISHESIAQFDNDLLNSNDTDSKIPSSVFEISQEIEALFTSSSVKYNTKQKSDLMRRYSAKLCSIGTMESAFCFLNIITYKRVDSGSVARYGLTTISNCTSNDENRILLIENGAGEFISDMLMRFGEEQISVAQYGIIAITNITTNLVIRSKLGSLQICPLIVRMLRVHGKSDETAVAVYGLFAIGKLSLNHDVNRQRFGSCGGCEEVIEILKKHGNNTHAVTDYGMYALAHLAYFNLENKHKLSHIETYTLIMQLLKLHGCEHVSITSFGLTAVSNLIHTDASKDRFGALGMCELVYQLGNHHKMKPEALANNVIFTIGKLTHKHAVNGELLVKLGGAKLVVQALQNYGIEKVSLSGNGLFALGTALVRSSALVQSSSALVCEQLANKEVVDMMIGLLIVHGVDDQSVAVYGLNILEAITTHSSAMSSYLVTDKVGLLLLHLLKAYVMNAFNTNIEIVCRVLNVLSAIFKVSTSKTFKDTLTECNIVDLLEQLVLLNPLVMDKQANQQAKDILSKF